MALRSLPFVVVSFLLPCIIARPALNARGTIHVNPTAALRRGGETALYLVAMTTFADVIRMWPTYRDLAEDCGVAYDTVASWHRRSNIPQMWWAAVERSAQSRNIEGISYDTLRSIEEHQRIGRRSATIAA